MRVALTGATGLAGHPIAAHLVGLGLDVVTLGRTPSPLGLPHVMWSLGERPEVTYDALVHCAFSHVPDRYRGGEGSDPEAFLRLNRDGTLRLLDAVPAARVVFLSSRAVYGDARTGICLTETMKLQPDTLYGQIKCAIEAVVTRRGGVSMRATGLYGCPPPGRAHKWSGLFADFAAGRRLSARVATELHVDDLAAAVALCLRRATPSLLNVSDIMLDRRDLLEAYAAVTGITGWLPDRGTAAAVSEMDCRRLRTLGWMPRGPEGLRPALEQMAGAPAA